MKTRSLALCGMLLAVVAAPAADTVFLEKGGIVAMEAESTGSSLGRWKKKTDVADYSGECHLEFTGNKPESGPPDSPLKYSFRINKGGTYRLTLRARKRLESKRQDISNDCFVALKGDYEAGGGTPKSILRDDTKMFGGNADGWGWTSQLDPGHKKFPAIYELKSGETYELTISGRSKNFNLDRILFIHESENFGGVQRDNPPESKSDGFGGSGFGVPERVRKTLRNKEGRAIKAELITKEGDHLIALVNGRRYRIPIESLSEDDQEFLKEWMPDE